MKFKKLSKDELIEYIVSILCIGAGTIAGVCCYGFCLAMNLAIFGWNIGLVLAPLVAGFVETYFAKRLLYETTGAISAFILFIVTVVYGFILTNPTLGGNLITIGSIGIIIQAAFPTLINYFLIVFIVSIASHSLGLIKKIKGFLFKIYAKIYYIFTGKTFEPKVKEEEPILVREVINTEDLGVLFLTTDNLDIDVLEYKGIYESVEFLRYSDKEMLKIEELKYDNDLLIEDVKFTKNKALVKMADNLKNDGCNAILGVDFQYDLIKKEKGSLIIQFSIIGTGVVI